MSEQCCYQKTGILNKNLSARQKLPLYEILVSSAPEASKTIQVIVIAFDFQHK